MKNVTKKIIVDIDDTITIHSSSLDYKSKLPNRALIEKLNEYKTRGYEVILHTSRNMKTYQGDIGKINKFTLPVLLQWLNENHIDYDGLIVGKPWCGEAGFYIDDKAIRPDEFLKLSEEEIQKLLGNFK